MLLSPQTIFWNVKNIKQKIRLGAFAHTTFRGSPAFLAPNNVFLRKTQKVTFFYETTILACRMSKHTREIFFLVFLDISNLFF